ncbi:hypothetical protein [Aquimarina litoralis]|uniref:hypothetical protein n=1 Tax=Aquimarina litoralis TaxID=584605 RepID=UPI001C560C02|nr:hypothetical protein [Aquimarina litoralis]MBW1297382.1 hypothetical protein [Aquimarina litoralis]
MEVNFDKIEKLIEKLKTSSFISNVNFESGLGISTEDFLDYSKEYTITISDEIKSFYSEFDGLRLSWNYISGHVESNQTIISENTKILPFYQMISGYDGNFWEGEIWSQNTSEKISSFYKRLKVFDYIENDNVHCICLELSLDNMLTPKMWIFRGGYTPIPLNIDITQYVDKLCQTKGFWGWQYLFTDIDLNSPENEGIKLGLKDSLRSYLNFFPEMRHLDFYKRMKQFL